MAFLRAHAAGVDRYGALPYIDEHHVRVGATPERTWDAVVELARRRLTRPAPAASAAAAP